MDLSINFDFFLIFKIYIQIHTRKIIFFLYFKLSYSKFARDLQNTQTQNQNSQKIENPNPDLNLWVLCVHMSGLYITLCRLFRNV